jgi:S-methylmethionine-dependent homocysteine/selenocysteine methylase
LSFFSEGKLNKGDDMAESVAQVLDYCSSNSIRLEAIGANCFNPKFTGGIISTMKSVCAERDDVMKDLSIVVYPNSGEKWDAREGHR